jgi:hypothetical protein
MYNGMENNLKKKKLKKIIIIVASALILLSLFVALIPTLVLIFYPEANDDYSYNEWLFFEPDYNKNILEDELYLALNRGVHYNRYGSDTVLTEDEIATIRLGSANEGGSTETEPSETEPTETEPTETEPTETEPTETEPTETEPQATEAPNTDATENNGTTGTDEAEGGCGSAIGGGIGLVLVGGICACGITAIRSKRKK